MVTVRFLKREPERVPPVLQGGAQRLSPQTLPLLSGSAGGVPPSADLPGSVGSGLPGSPVGGRLQLRAVQQLRPLLLPDAALH